MTMEFRITGRVKAMLTASKAAKQKKGRPSERGISNVVPAPILRSTEGAIGLDKKPAR
jgi:hypothetical protein